MSLRLLLLAAVLCARVALASAPHAGPEFVLAPPDDVPAPGNKYQPVIASRGDEAFAVWTDERVYPSMLIGTRIGADGTILDPHGILLDVYAGLTPQVVWTGSEYLVFSTEYTTNFAKPTWAHRVSPDGKLLARTFVGTFLSTQLYGNGKEAVMVVSVPGERFLAFLDADGRIRQKLTLKSDIGMVVLPDGSDWVVLMARSACEPKCFQALVQFRISGGKVVFEREVPAPLLALPSRMTAATDGNGRFLLFWNDISSRTVDNLLQQDEVTGTMWYLMTDREANVITPPHAVDRINAKFFTRPNNPIRYIGPSTSTAVTWFNDRFVLVWPWLDSSGRSEVRAISVEPDGDRIERSPVTVDTMTDPIVAPYKRPAVAATRSRLHLFWANTNRRIQTWVTNRSVASLGELSAPFEGTNRLRSTSTHRFVESAAGGDAVFIAWTEDGVGEPRLRGRIVRNDGSQSAEIAISQSDLGAETPAIAFTAGLWLVAWIEDEYRVDSTGERDLHTQRVLVRRYDRGGTPLDAEPRLIALEHHYPAGGWRGPARMSVAASGFQFAVTWTGPNGGASAIRVMRIGTDGTPADAEPLLLASEAGNATRGSPYALWTGTDYFIGWQEEPYVPGVPGVQMARSARVSTGGATAGSSPELASTASGWDVSPSAFEPATNGKEILLTWSERRYNVRGCVYAQRFTFDGAAAGPREELLCAPGTNALPNRTFAVWDGEQFRVLYSFEDALWSHTIGSGTRQKVFETTGNLSLGRPIVTRVGIVVPYTRSDTAHGSVPRAFRRTISFEPPRRRSVR